MSLIEQIRGAVIGEGALIETPFGQKQLCMPTIRRRAGRSPLSKIIFSVQCCPGMPIRILKRRLRASEYGVA